MDDGTRHPLAERTRRLYERLATGDLTGYFDMLADDVVFHIGGSSIVAGEHRGKQAIAALGQRIFTETAELSVRRSLPSMPTTRTR